MQWVWKLLLLTTIGGYWLYRRKKAADNRPKQSVDDDKLNAEGSAGVSETGRASGGTVNGEEAKAPEQEVSEEISEEEVVRQLSKVEGVTSRVAKNLFERGIYTPHALRQLSEEELLSVTGIGPKRKEKIMNSGTTE